MESICYRISQISKMILYALCLLKSFFETRRIVGETHYKSLSAMFEYFERKYPYNTNTHFLLFKAELWRAKKNMDCEMPDNIVKMDSIVSVKNIKTDKKLTIHLVYPYQEQLTEFKLSVFTAIGMVLFGQKNGTIVSCFKGKRKIQLEILSIV